MRATCGILIAIVILIVGCASSQPTYPALSQIATPDGAEKVLYAAAKTYEFTLTVANREHRAGRFSDDRHEAVIAVANRFRTSMKLAYAAIQTWRAVGDRTGFDAAYTAALAALTELRAMGVL